MRILALCALVALATLGCWLPPLPPIPYPPTPTPTPSPLPTAEPSPSTSPTPVPSATPTPTLEPTAAPSATPTPTPVSSSCTCQVVCTLYWLGWNNRPGLPPNVVVGGNGSGDVTCRQAQHPGDQRGQPMDRSAGPKWCEPARDPVTFDVSVPGGVGWSVENDGYRIDLRNLKEGSYRIEAKPNPHAVYRNGTPVTLCGWGHGSQRTVLEFIL